MVQHTDKREYIDLVIVVVFSILLAVFTIIVPLNDYLYDFFKAYRGAEFVFNFTFLLLTSMIFLLYRRWRKAKYRRKSLENILQSINPDVLIVVDSSRKIKYCNGTVSSLFGYEPDEVLGQQTDVLYFDRRKDVEVEKEIYHIVQENGFHIGNAKGKRKDGSVFPLEIITGDLKEEEGAVLLLRNIESRTEYKNGLSKHEKRFEDLFESSPDPIYVLDKLSIIIDVNEAACEFHKTSREEIIKTDLISHIPEKYRESNLFEFSKVCDGLIRNKKLWLFDSERNEIPVEVTANPLISDTLEVIILHLRDISEQYKYEHELELERDFQKAILQNSYDGIAVFHKDGRILMLSPAMERLFGYPKNEISTVEQWLDCCFQDIEYREYMKNIIQSEFTGSGELEYTIKLNCKSGRLRWCRFNFSLMDDEQLVVNGMDITESKLIQDALEESEVKYRNVVERANDGIVMIQNEKVIFCNSRTQELLKTTEKRIINQPFAKFLHPDFLELCTMNYKARISGKEVPTFYEAKLITSKNTIIPIEINAGIIQFQDEPADLVFIKDVSERKAAERDIQHRLNYETLISDISTGFINKSSDEVDNEIRKALAKVAAYTNVDISSFYIFDENMRFLTRTYEWISDDISGEVVDNGRKVDVKNMSRSMKQFEMIQPLIIDDTEEGDQFISEEILNVCGNSIKSILSMPLSYNNKLVAVYNIATIEKVINWTDENTNLLRFIGEIIVNALQRRWAEQSLLESEERYKFIVNSAHDIIYTLDKKGNFTYVNKRGEELSGYNAEEWIGKDFTPIVHPNDLPNITRLFLDCLSGNSNDYEVRIIGRDKTISELYVLTHPMKKDGKVIGTVSFGRDITTRKKAERELAKSQGYYRNLIQKAPIGIMVCGIDGEINDYNKPMETILHFGDLNETQSIFKSEFMTKTKLTDVFWDTLESDAPIEREVQFIMEETESFHYHIRMVPLHNADSEIDGVLIMIEDITSRKRIEKALRYSEERYRSLQNNVPVGVFRATPDGKILTANNTLVKLLGYETLEDLLEVGVAKTYLNPSDRDRFMDTLNSKTFIDDFETILTRKDGINIWVTISARAIIDDEGHVVHHDGIMKDITEVKRAREALMSSEQQYRTTIDSMGDTIHLVNRRLELVMANKALINWNNRFNLTTDVIGKRLIEIFPFLTTRVISEYEKVFLTGESIITEESTFVNGMNIITETRKIPVFEAGKVDRVITIIRDITERKSAEEELRLMATTDALTGVMNRHSGLKLLERQMFISKQEKTPLTVCYIDVNELKMINDTFGHLEGDHVLTTISRIFKQSVRNHDIIMRLGGDEFLLVHPKCTQENAEKIWDRIETRMKSINENLEKPYKLSISHGFVVFHHKDNIEIDQLIAMADAAMYKDKKTHTETQLFLNNPTEEIPD